MADQAGLGTQVQSNGIGVGGNGGNNNTLGSNNNNSAPPAFDINTLAAFVEQFQKQQGKQLGSTTHPPGLQDALAAAMGNGGGSINNNGIGKDPMGGGGGAGGQEQDVQGGGGTNNNQSQPNDSQGLMEQIATLTRNLESEKTKSKALQEEKKREMKGFLTGIKDYVNGLDNVKDPNAKTKFMQGMENMANHGIPNGVYDIMVSASAQNENNIRTIEALTKGYTELKDRYEGSGQFSTESSRFVDPSVKIMGVGSKRKTTETEDGKVPIGMWDAFGDDIARVGYSNQSDLLNGV